MPYTIDNPPDRIKDLPKHAKEIWIASYNSAHKQYNGDEQKSNATAWAAVKKKYKKNKEGKWVKMNEPRLIFDVSMDFKEAPDGKYKSIIPIARTGKWKHPEYGDFEISSKDLNEIEANFGTVRESQPPVNYEHGEGVDASIGAAGWIQSIARSDGRLEGEVYWTKDAWDKIQNGAFKYISPEIHFNYKDKEDGDDKGTVLTGAALTTKPWIEDLAIVLSEKVFTDNLIIDAIDAVKQLKEIKKGGELEVDIKTLIEKLKLNENATEEDVINAIEGLLNKPKVDLTGIRKKLNLNDDADIESIVKAIDELLKPEGGKEEKEEGKEEKTELSEQVASLSETAKDLTVRLTESEKKREAMETQLKEKDFDLDFNSRMQKGTILPKMKEWAKSLYLRDPNEYKSIAETMPMMVDLSVKGADAGGEVDAIKKFNDEMDKIQNERKLSYREAIIIVSREKPELWKEYQEATRR